MNTVEKEKQQRFILQNIGGIASAIQSIVSAKDAYRQKLNDLAVGRNDFSKDYLDRQIDQVKQDWAAKMQAANTDMKKRFEELRGLLHDRDNVLDLSNPALTNALSLIQTLGSSLTFEQAIKINANFVHDQSALRMLQDAYKAQSVVSPGNIDAMIYNADSSIDNLESLAYQGLVQDGSINFFASAFSKLAALEGMTTETMPDEQGDLEAIRAAAGL